MPKRIYVGNLPFSSTTEEVRNLVRRYGKAVSVSLDAGVAAVDFQDESAAVKALSGLRGAKLGGRGLNVSEARPRG